MNIGDVLNKVYDQTIDFSKGVFIAGFIGGCIGYTIATLSNANPRLMARTVAIASIGFTIFERCANAQHKLNSDERELLKTTAAFLTGTTLIAALFNLELISKVGAGVLFGAHCIFIGYSLSR